MPALGFGQQVTGAGSDPSVINEIPVTIGGKSGAGSLAQAILDAATPPTGKTATRITIAPNLKVETADAQITVRARNLTITGGAGSTIKNNLLYFDCSASDNVLMEKLSFTGASDDKGKLRDSIKLDATTGRGPIGFWIDHCNFEAAYDLNITSNANDPPADNPTLKPLLITISNCYFHNDHPDGKKHKNNGAIGIHGATGDPDDDPNLSDDDDSSTDSSNSPGTGTRNTQTNAYATICNNFFDHIRRRSPRSSGLCVVHAFNNVLVEWGASGTNPPQVNGMQSGHDGRLVAQANFFAAGSVKQPIDVSTTAGIPGALTIKDGSNSAVRNLYKDTTLRPAKTGTVIDIGAVYMGLNLTSAPVQPMTDALKETIKRAAGTS